MWKRLLIFWAVVVVAAVGYYFIAGTAAQRQEKTAESKPIAPAQAQRPDALPRPPQLTPEPPQAPADGHPVEPKPADEATRARQAAQTLRLSSPIPGLKKTDISDMFGDHRGEERQHEALDIMAPKRTPVLAVDDGVIKKLFTSTQGGLTIYHFDPSERYSYYYAHLDGYAPGLVEGKQVRRGELIGYVGVTGNSDPNGPHLHFAVNELDETKSWWKGAPLNPYPLLISSLP